MKIAPAPNWFFVGVCVALFLAIAAFAGVALGVYFRW